MSIHARPYAPERLHRSLYARPYAPPLRQVGATIIVTDWNGRERGFLNVEKALKHIQKLYRTKPHRPQYVVDRSSVEWQHMAPMISTRQHKFSHGRCAPYAANAASGRVVDRSVR